MLKRLSLLLLAVALMAPPLAAPARAMQAAAPPDMIQKLVNEAIQVIEDKQETDQQRATKFRSLLETGFDIPRISRFVLGRYWTAATEQQRQQFTKLFEDWIVGTYSSRFRDYSGETIQVMGTRPETDTTSVVLSQFLNGNGKPPAKVEWHVRKTGDGDYKIVDVSVEGVSMALTQRDEIAAVADRSGGTIEALNQALAQKIQSGEPAPAPGGNAAH
jgi:phospholipid transport system substrate-binding protein